jgi:hypothetical protein
VPTSTTGSLFTTEASAVYIAALGEIVSYGGELYTTGPKKEYFSPTHDHAYVIKVE